MYWYVVGDGMYWYVVGAAMYGIFAGMYTNVGILRITFMWGFLLCMHVYVVVTSVTVVFP